jgi:hypothetical protein
MSAVLVVIAGMVFPADRLPGWMLADPAQHGARRVAPVDSLLSRNACWPPTRGGRVSAQHLRQYSLLWAAATTCLLTLTMVLWGVVRIYVALDIHRFQALMILVAVLAVPLARVGLAPSRLARNRHR